MFRNKKILKRLIFSICVLLFVNTTYSQWNQINTLSNIGLHPSISIVSQNIFVVAGGNNSFPKIYLTTNGGINFSSLSTSGISLELYCVWAQSSNTIFVGDGGSSGGHGGNAHVYKTTNGGTNWTNILSTGGSKGFFNGIVFSYSNPQFGIAQSDPPNAGEEYFLAKTTNSGINWTVIYPPLTGTASSQNSVFCIDENFFGFGLNNGAQRIYFTSDGGNSWSLKELIGAGGSAGFVSSISFNSDKTNGLGAGSGTTTTVSRTTDGGNNWFSQTIPCTISGYCNIDWIPGTSMVYLIVSNSSETQSFRSSNNGINWVSYTYPANAYNCNHMDVTITNNSGIMGAISSNGAVAYLTETPMPVKLESFISIIQERNVLLKWSTSSEINNFGFDIEKTSTEQLYANWEKIGFVKGKGNSNSSTTYFYKDLKLNSGKYQYRLKQSDLNGNYEYFNLNSIIEINLPKAYNLSQNYPNPFNPITKIDFEIPIENKISLRIYDLMGREITSLINNENMKAGFYTIEFNAANLSSGIYFYRFLSNKAILTKKLMVIK